MSEYINTKEVADMLGVSTAMLERHRCANYKHTSDGEIHPLATLPYIKIANIVRYKRADVLELIERLKAN